MLSYPFSCVCMKGGLFGKGKYNHRYVMPVCSFKSYLTYHESDARKYCTHITITIKDSHMNMLFLSKFKEYVVIRIFSDSSLYPKPIQIKNILAPSIADPKGTWKSCKLGIKNCSPAQIHTMQGKYRNPFLYR